MNTKLQMKTLCRSIATAVILTASAQSMAGAVLTNSAGDLAIGVNDEGHLNTSDGNVAVNGGGSTGIAYDYGDGFQDATAPGCLCEGWGVSASGSSGFANVDSDGGANNLTVDNFTADATSITSAVHLTSMPGLSVEQVYTESTKTDRLFVDTITITNTTGSTLTDLRYVRVMDWDIPPSEFSELVSITGTDTTTNLERSHDNGFETADPLAMTSPSDASTLDTDFTDSGPADHGAYFKFNFGDLADGDFRTFKIFYGAAAGEVAMLAALALEEVELFSLGQSAADGLPATFAFGFSGVGGSVILPPPGGPGPSTVPVPPAFVLMGSGLVALFGFRKKVS